MTKLFILSPTGTSLLTNQSQGDERKWVGKYANAQQFEDIPAEAGAVLRSLADRAQNKLQDADLELATRMSAELNGIIKIYTQHYAHQPHQNPLFGKGAQDDMHYLLCTDTWLGETTANLVKGWLEAKGFTVQVNRQRRLQTLDIHEFQLALSEIVQWCQEVLPGYQQSGYRVVFNLTGGFKSVQGFLQTLAGFYADEAVYIFETATDLLRIPRLPVKMDAESVVLNYLTQFRRLALGLLVDDVSGIPETLVITEQGTTVPGQKPEQLHDLSPWGKLVWGETRSPLYEKKVYPSPSPRILFSEDFERSVENLTGDRLLKVNERMDDLAQYLELGGSRSLARLDFKKLKGNPCPPSTHEMDAWSDLSAKRMFGHFEGDTFVLDKLDDGLH